MTQETKSAIDAMLEYWIIFSGIEIYFDSKQELDLIWWDHIKSGVRYCCKTYKWLYVYLLCLENFSGKKVRPYMYRVRRSPRSSASSHLEVEIYTTNYTSPIRLYSVRLSGYRAIRLIALLRSACIVVFAPTRAKVWHELAPLSIIEYILAHTYMNVKNSCRIRSSSSSSNLTHYYTTKAIT